MLFVHCDSKHNIFAFLTVEATRGSDGQFSLLSDIHWTYSLMEGIMWNLLSN